MAITQVSNYTVEGSEIIESCCHHWVISAPDGPVSVGKCRICSETREFKNFVESFQWGEDGREEGREAQVDAPIAAVINEYQSEDIEE